MRKEKVIDLGDRRVVVKELRVRDIRNLVSLAEEIKDIPLKELLKGENYNRLCHLFLCCVDLTADDVDKLSFSDLKRLADVIVEVNEDFFGLLRVLSMAAIMKES